MIRLILQATLSLTLLASVSLIPGTVQADELRGGLLWDKWWVVNGATEPTGDHPLYPPAGPRTGSTTYRCKECHGWDYKGVDGAYSSGSHYTGIPGIFGTTLTAGELTDLIKTTTVTNGHGYENYGLTDTDIADLVDFIQNLVIDTDLYIDGTNAFLGDEVQGESNYASGALPCSTCHGAEGTAINFGSPDDPDWVGTIAVDNPWEMLHKIRFGQPGTGMPSWLGDGGNDQGAADIGAYSQQNQPAHSLCIDEPRATCAQSAKALVLVKNPIDPAKAQLKFKWSKGDETVQADFGDPDVVTNYALCLYDSVTSVASLAGSVDVRPNAAWLSLDPKGWKYKDKTGAFAGLQKAKLKPGASGKSKASAIAKGAGLILPAAVSLDDFFTQDTEVIVQLANENEQCWTATFTSAKKNEADLFKAKQP